MHGHCYVGTCSDVEQYVAQYEVEELDLYIGQLSHYGVYLDQYVEEKKNNWTGQNLQINKSIPPHYMILGPPQESSSTTQSS